jgi:hypothetical protein
MRHPPRSVKRLLDVFVYAPLGFLVEAPRLLPELAETGRRRVTDAGSIGRLAVQVGSQRFGNRVDANDPTSSIEVIPDVAPPAAVDVERPDPVLPIPGYDQLAASQIVARLGDLDAGGLAAVEDYEQAHRKRRTVLTKVAQLRRE